MVYSINTNLQYINTIVAESVTSTTSRQPTWRDISGFINIKVSQDLHSCLELKRHQRAMTRRH